MPMNHDPAEAT